MVTRREWYARPPRRSSRLTVFWVVATLITLLASCDLLVPLPTLPPDEAAVQTRVVATLTAMSAVTPLPYTPSPTQPSVLPTPTHTPVPPSPTPLPTDTVPPPTPTATLVVPLSTPTPLSPTNTPTPKPTVVPTPTNTPVLAITDWRGEYYANRDLVGAPTLVRNDLAVNFDWGRGAPAVGLPSDNFSARWTRYLNFEAATYRFHIYVDDGVRLWVDDDLIIDAWYDSSAYAVTGSYPMFQGTHRIQVEYYEHGGEALIQLWWEKAEYYPNWKGEYWSNRDLSGSPVLVRNDREVNFNWAGSSPAPRLPADNFSARWTRDVEFEAATYRFHALVDDGVRLWVDHNPIIDAWYDGSTHEVTANTSLTQGTHSLRVEYYEHTGDAQVRVWWERISSPSYPDWKGEYWANRDLSGKPALVRNDPAIDFNWGRNAAAPGLPDDNFSVRWSRQVNFETGIYRFKARADDGIRFYLDGHRILDEWHDSIGDTAYQVELTLTGKHQLVVEYYEHGWDAWVRFWWKRLRLGPVRE
ncbi:MAG: hypothetical protein JSV36_08970 [Anaerolineae bacterium]|nr:MAG: hypothetical protein JSV36_08970 [Anaerolineae bacterium]